MKSKLELFMESLKADVLTAGMEPLLAAVWHGLRGEWIQAHDIAQDDNSADAAWIHAWLHREEGDAPNAAYWYKRAMRAVEKQASFKDEGAQIAEYLLDKD